MAFILSLDCSTKSTGWAIYNSKKQLIDYGCITASSTDLIKRISKMVQGLDEVCKKYPDYSVVVLTHHCPGIKSIASRYSGNDCNGAYASNLDDFIVNHPNIKVWCCGHVHNTHSYDIAQCKVLANPHGYDRYYESNGWNNNELNFELKDGNVTMIE